MRRLAATVHVHADDGTSHVFGPGDLVPAWAADRITNPKAWDSPADDEYVGGYEHGTDIAPRSAVVELPAGTEIRSSAKPESQSVSSVVAVVEGSTATTPPRTGPGSSRAAWRAYAQALGVTTRADASRDEIIAAIDAKGP